MRQSVMRSVEHDIFMVDDDLEGMDDPWDSGWNWMF